MSIGLHPSCATAGRAALLAGACLAGAPLAAESVYVPMCLYSAMLPQELRFFSVPADAFFGYDVYNASPGYVMYRGNVPSGEIGDDLIVLEYCANATRLVATLDSQGLSPDAHFARVDAVWEAVRYRAVGTQDTYTLDQIADVARALGARTRIETANYQSCACATPEAARW